MPDGYFSIWIPNFWNNQDFQEISNLNFKKGNWKSGKYAERVRTEKLSFKLRGRAAVNTPDTL